MNWQVILHVVSPSSKVSDRSDSYYYGVERGRLIQVPKEASSKKASLSSVAAQLFASLDTLSIQELLGLQRAFYEKHKNQPLLLRPIAQQIFRLWNKKFLRKLEATLQKKHQEMLEKAKQGDYKPLLQHFLGKKKENQKLEKQLDLLSTYLASLPKQEDVFQKIVRGQGDLIFAEMLQKGALFEKFPEFIEVTSKFFSIESFKESDNALFRKAALQYCSSESSIEELEELVEQLEQTKKEASNQEGILVTLLRAKIALKGKSVVDTNWYAALQQGRNFTLNNIQFQVTPKGVEPIDSDPTKRRYARLVLIDALITKRDWERVSKLFTLALTLPEGDLTADETLLLKKIMLSQRDEIALRAAYILLRKNVQVEIPKNRVIAYEKMRSKAISLEQFEMKLLLKSVGMTGSVKAIKREKLHKVGKKLVPERQAVVQEQYEEALKPFVTDFTRSTTKPVESLPQVQKAKREFLQIANQVLQKQMQKEAPLKAPYDSLKNLNSIQFSETLAKIEADFSDKYQKAYLALYAKLPITAPSLHTLMIYHAQGRLEEFGLGVCKEALMNLLEVQQELQKCGRIRQNPKEIEQERNYDPKKYPYLQVLEVFLNVYARPEQVRVIEEMSISNTNAIVQLLMGSGKSFLLLPLLALVRANGENIASIMVPDALLMNSENGLRETLGVSYGNFVYMLPEISTDNSLEALESMYDHLVAVQENRGVVIVSPDRKHALLNSLALTVDDPKASNEQIQMVLKVLHLLSSSESIMGDEVDTLLKTSLKYIVTKGQEERFAAEQAEFISDLVLNLPTHSVPLESIYREQLLPSLVEKALAKLPKEYDQNIAKSLFTIRTRTKELEKECDAVEAYLSTLSLEKREFLIGVRTALQLVIPTTLTSHCNEEFGVTMLQETFVATPFAGPNSPTKTQYSSPIEQLVRSIVALKKQGIPLAAAHKYGIKNPENIVDDPAKFRLFLHHFLFPQLTIHEERVSSGAQRLVSSAKNFSGFSGTFWNLSTFPFFDREVPDAEQEVEALLKIGQKQDITIQKSSERELLKKINDEGALALIDAAGWLKEYAVRDFANQILASRPELDGVIFHTEERVQVELRRDGKEYAEFSLPEKRFTIYAKQYTTGTDTLQAATARAIMPVDKKMILRDGEQAIFRMRKILQGQTCTILYDDEFEVAVRHTIETDPETPFSYQTLIRFLLVNQEVARVNENYPAVHERMQDALQNRVYQFLLEEGAKPFPDFEKIRALFKVSRWLFIDENKKVEGWSFPVEREREVQVELDIQQYAGRAYEAMQYIGCSLEDVQALLRSCYRIEDLNPRLEGQKDPIAARVGQQEQVQNQSRQKAIDYAPVVVEGPLKTLQNIETVLVHEMQAFKANPSLPQLLYEQYESFLAHARYLSSQLRGGGDGIYKAIDQMTSLIDGVKSLQYQTRLAEEAQDLTSKAKVVEVSHEGYSDTFLDIYSDYQRTLTSLKKSLVDGEQLELHLQEFKNAQQRLENEFINENARLEQRFQKVQKAITLLGLTPPQEIVLKVPPTLQNVAELGKLVYLEQFIIAERSKSLKLIQKQLQHDAERLQSAPKYSQLNEYHKAEKQRLKDLKSALHRQASLEELSRHTATFLGKGYDELVAKLERIASLKRSFSGDPAILKLLIQIESNNEYENLSALFLEHIKTRTSEKEIEEILQNQAFHVLEITEATRAHLKVVQERNKLFQLYTAFPKKGVPQGLANRYQLFEARVKAANTIEEIQRCQSHYNYLKQDVEWTTNAIKTLAQAKQQIAALNTQEASESAWVHDLLLNGFTSIAEKMKESQLTKADQRKFKQAIEQLTKSITDAYSLQTAVQSADRQLRGKPKLRLVRYSKELAAADMQLHAVYTSFAELMQDVRQQHTFDKLSAFSVFAQEKIQAFARKEKELESEQKAHAQIEKKIATTISSSISKAVPLLQNVSLKEKLQKIAELDSSGTCSEFDTVFEEVRALSKTELQERVSDAVGGLNALENRVDRLSILFPEGSNATKGALGQLKNALQYCKTVTEVEAFRENIQEIEKKIVYHENQKALYESLLNSVRAHFDSEEISSYEAYISILSLYDSLGVELRKKTELVELSKQFTLLLAKSGQLDEALRLQDFLELDCVGLVVEEYTHYSASVVREKCRLVFDNFLFQDSTEIGTLSAQFYETYFKEGALLLEKVEQLGAAEHAERAYKRFVQQTAVVQAELYAETLGPIAQSILELDYSNSSDEALLQMYSWLKSAVDFMEVCNRSYVGQSKESAASMYKAYQDLDSACKKISERVDSLRKKKSVVTSVIKTTCFGVAGITAIGSGFAPAMGLYFIRMAAQNAADPIIDSVTNQLPKNLQPFARQFMQIGAGFATESVFSRYQNIILEGVTNLTGFNVDVQDSVKKMNQMALNVSQGVANQSAVQPSVHLQKLNKVAANKLYTQPMSGVKGTTTLYTRQWKGASLMTIPTQAEWKAHHVNQIAESLQKMKQVHQVKNQLKQTHQKVVAQMISNTLGGSGEAKSLFQMLFGW